MQRIKQAVITTVFVAATALAGCAPSPYVAYAVPPPPPPRVVGAAGYAPGPGYVWIDGFWDLRGSRWAWAPGYWGRPPRVGAVWVRPYWEPHGRSYRFHRGYWR